MARGRQGIILRVPIVRILAAFAVALLVMVPAAMKRERAPVKDELNFLAVAHDLSAHGTFTDGAFAKPEAGVQPGRFLAPAYPLLVHALAQADASLAEAVTCHARPGAQPVSPCGGSFRSLILAQSLLLAVGAAAIFLIAFQLTQSQPAAWLALGLGLAAGEMRDLPRFFLSEALALPAFLVFLAAAVAWTGRRDSLGLAAMAGLAIALAALARPSYLYLFYAAGAFLLVAGPLMGLTRSRTRGLAVAAAFWLAGLALIAPWMARNALLFGDNSLTAGYGAFTLAQRVAYNAMTLQEWLVAWIYWLPDFGDNLIKALLPPSAYVRLGWTDPDSFYLVGAGPLYAETLAAAGSSEAHLGYLLQTHVLGDLGWHLAVSLPLTMRGIWAGGYLGIAALVLAVPFLGAQKTAGRLAATAALALPLLFMAGLHGFVSVNIVRYNEAMIALYATVVAWALVELWRRHGTGITDRLARSGSLAPRKAPPP